MMIDLGIDQIPQSEVRRLSGIWLRLGVLGFGTAWLALRLPELTVLIVPLAIYLAVVVLAVIWPREHRPFKIDMLYPFLVGDTAAITLVAHGLGAQTFPITALYIPLVLGYALQTSRRAGTVAFLCVCLFYGGVLLLEELGILERAPLVRGALPPHTAYGGAAVVFLVVLLCLAAGYMFVIYVLRNIERRHAHELELTAAEQEAREYSERLEAELEDARRLEGLGRLAGGIAHDFNNLLTSMLGYTEIVQERLASDDESRQDLAQVLDGATRAAALADQLLAFSRQQVRSLRTLDLNQLVLEWLPSLQERLGEGYTCDLSAQARPTWIVADPRQLGQILCNLVDNAREAMPDGGQVSIAVDRRESAEPIRLRGAEVRPGRYAILRVTDTGKGMGADARARVFEPFFSTKPMADGAGLGLSTVYGIVRQNGGLVDVSSEPGRGACFEVLLPISDQAEKATDEG